MMGKTAMPVQYDKKNVKLSAIDPDEIKVQGYTNEMTWEFMQNGYVILRNFIPKDIIKNFTAVEIKNLYLKPSPHQIQASKIELELDSISLKTWGEKIITRAKNANSLNTAAWYSDAVSAITKYSGGDIRLSEITPTFLKDFEAHRTGLNYAVNGIAAHLRALRALLNKANEEITGANFEPFKKFKIKTQRTKKRAIPLDVFRKFRDYIPDNINSTNKNLQRSAQKQIEVKMIFLFSFDNRGMNFIDMAKLTKSNFKDVEIKKGKIVAAKLEYQRSKLARGSNPENFVIKQTASALEALNYFNILEKAKDEVIFPFGWDETPKGRNNYKQRLKRINTKFKDIMTILNYDEDVSSYWIRHSWASIARQSGVSIEHIGAGLGHKSYETTKVYLTDFEDNLIDDINDQIIAATLS